MSLKVMDIYNEANAEKIKSFQTKNNTKLKINLDYDKTDVDYEWLEIMEDSIKYIDNILRNPNRFIVNEEEVIKIELARRVTVESIKHLSRNTNLIQDYDKKTGDVRPSKILNINKEESFNTYENRFIYSLIQNMRSFIERKKSSGPLSSYLKSDKRITYTGNTKVGEEIVNVNMELNSKLHSTNNKNNKNNNELTIEQRIEKLELQISDLTNSEVYKNLAKLHVALVTSPIKKTNVILKNVNFQYAVKLWNYMQENLDGNTKRTKENKDYEETGDLKQYIDETFMLNYLVMDTLSKDNITENNKKVLNEKIINNMIGQVVSLDSGITVEELKNIVGKQYEIIKYKNVTNDKAIRKIFDKNIDKYLNRIKEIKI